MSKTPTSTSFEERYAKLNKDQKLAVDTIDGPVMVVAGPGTGKTEVLTMRIANILLQTDTAPANILALTFTDAAATNMRRRLAHLIGVRAYQVAIKTFHSFCNDIIQNYPEYFPNIIGSAAMTDVESIAIVEHLIKTLSTPVALDLLRPWGDPLYYISSVVHKIEELKREGLSPDEFSQLVARETVHFKGRDDLYHDKGAYKGKMKSEHKKFEKKLVKNAELAMLYTEYQKVLHERRLYDWSDMIMEVKKHLEDDVDLKLILQETYQYILVDEHQDTNNAQNKIISLLSDFHENPNIFIVGDEKQAIFRFQGASVENFLYIRKLYPDARVIELSTNYRSGQPILDAAHSLIPSHSVLQAGDDKVGTIEVAAFSHKTTEEHFVAERIQKLIEQGVSAGQIAIIYRSNKESFTMCAALEKLGVRCTIESDEDLLSETYVRKLLVLLDAISQYGDESYLVPVLHIGEFGISPLDAYTLILEARKEKKNMYEMMATSVNALLVGLAEKLSDWATHSHNEHLSQFLDRVLRESGMLDSMLAAKNAEAFLGIERLFEEGKRISANRPGAVLKDFMEFIDLVRQHELFIKRPKHRVVDAVHLMTAHKAKGQEFEYVHIIHAGENSFGPKRNREKLPLLGSVYALGATKSDEEKENDAEENQAEADERRLFYVALTRAKTSCFISYSESDESGKEILPSPFIVQIRDDRKVIVDTSDYEQNMKEHPASLYAERQPTSTTPLDADFVRELFEAHPMSVSALNNYLSCPWKYFYRNLLRIPAAQERYQIYGTAMHAAIEDMWRSAVERGTDKEYLVNSYKRELGLLGVLTPSEFDEALLRGTEALSGWFDWRKPTLSNTVVAEYRLPAVELVVEESASVYLNGVLDNVEFLGPKSVVVTDYKTGKQRSRNYIEGKTADSKKISQGDMKRQLIFYRLLLELHDNTKMKEGVIEFVEPDSDTGGYRREVFEVSDEEVAELKATIARVAKEITTLAFWNKTCDEKGCEYCAYRKLVVA